MTIAKQSVLIIALLFLFTSCGNGVSENDIIGKWEVTKQEFVENGEVDAVQPGNGEEYLFNADGSGEWTGDNYDGVEIEWTLSGDKLGYSISFMNPSFTIVKEDESNIILIQEGEDYSVKKYLTKLQ